MEMTIYVLGRTPESNLYDITLRPLDKQSFYDTRLPALQDPLFNIDLNQSSPQPATNNVVRHWEEWKLKISGNFSLKFEHQLVSGLERINNLPLFIRNKLASSMAKALRRWPPPPMPVSVGVSAVVHLYTKEREREFLMMPSITLLSSQCFVMGELESVKIEGGEDKCAICLEEFSAGSEAAKLPCSHVFHGRCVAGWIKDRLTCPLCRDPSMLRI